LQLKVKKPTQAPLPNAKTPPKSPLVVPPKVLQPALPAILSAPSRETLPTQPLLLSPTSAIHTMMFSDGPTLSSLLHPLILQQFNQNNKTQSFLIQAAKPATVPANVKERLATMVNEMTKKIDPRFSPTIESFQVGISRKGSQTMKQR
jgi:hypothetical protein